MEKWKTTFPGEWKSTAEWNQGTCPHPENTHSVYLCFHSFQFSQCLLFLDPAASNSSWLSVHVRPRSLREKLWSCPWITVVPVEPNDSAYSLWCLCSVSALQPCSACTPNSQHLHLFVGGLPSGCIRPAFSAHMESRHCLGILSPQVSPWPMMDKYGNINTPATSILMDCLWCDLLHLQNLSTELWQVTSAGLCLICQPCLSYFPSLSHVPTTLFFFWESFSKVLWQQDEL